MRMNLKILAAFAMPLLTLGLIGGILTHTHHTSLPSLARPSASPTSTTPALLKASRCTSELHKPFTGVAVTKITSDAVQNFTAATKSGLSIIEFYSKFPAKFNEGGAMSAVDLQSIPLLQLDPGKSGNGAVLRQIANGKDDKEIKTYAESVKEFGYCIIISFGHEMNGWWYRWGAPWNTPATFIKAWRHVWTIFTKAGADNVIWSWDPSHQYTRLGPGLVATPASDWYPGKQYVDWVGLDGYLGTDVNGAPQNFDEIFAPQIASVRSVAPHKPLYLAETAVAPTSAEPRQIEELFAGIKRNNMIGLVWFDENRKLDWRLRVQMKGAKDAIAAYTRGMSGFPSPQPVDFLPGTQE